MDPVARTADVQGMCTYENLVDATLPYGLAPLVVPQLKTITLGGAVTGLGIESTSFRNGLPHESVLEIDILTGSGDILTATPDNEHADLFRSFPNSYGTLGYSTRIRIELEPVKKYVALRHLRFTDLTRLQETMERIATERSWDGTAVDYLDGVVFTPPRPTSRSVRRPTSPDRSATTPAWTSTTGPSSTSRSITPNRPAHHPRLPVALGHRLVLVLPRLRHPEPQDPPLLAETLPTQQLLLETHRPRPEVRHRRPPRSP